MLMLVIDAGGALYIPTLMADMLNLGVAGGNVEYLVQKGLQMLVMSVLSGAGAILGGYACADLSAKIGRDMRNAIYQKSLTLSVFDYRQFGTASITTRTLSDVTQIQQAIIMCIQIILPVPIVSAIALYLAFQIDHFMGLILIVAIIAILVFALFIMRRAAPLFQRLQKLLDKMNGVLRENITGVRVIRAFNKEQKEEKRLEDTFSSYADTAIRANRMFANLDGLSFFILNMFVVAVMWLCGGRITEGYMQIGDITALTEYALLTLFYIMMAQMVILLLPRARTCCARVGELLNYSPEITDAQQITMPKEGEQNVVCFQQVSFRFADAEEYTLEALDFICRRGETTAIIGGTGSGKSTIASLMLRFHDVTQGRILFNGVDIKELPQEVLRERIGYVQQKAWLFSGTIRENLCYGRQNATDEELWQALRTAQAEDFVKKLPNGLDSFVAQGGNNFSGGQKQRLSIARALVKRPELYIFDDSFSALDFKTDAALRRAMKKDVRDAAVLIIAQRISSIMDADKIVVLNDGKAVGIGTHLQLMDTCSVYREIYESQTKEV
jgi:hypothetical protein